VGCDGVVFPHQVAAVLMQNLLIDGTNKKAFWMF
jgi:hypothetical protein